jgi:hypothetical protein
MFPKLLSECAILCLSPNSLLIWRLSVSSFLASRYSPRRRSMFPRLFNAIAIPRLLPSSLAICRLWVCNCLDDYKNAEPVYDAIIQADSDAKRIAEAKARSRWIKENPE